MRLAGSPPHTMGAGIRFMNAPKRSGVCIMAMATALNSTP